MLFAKQGESAEKFGVGCFRPLGRSFGDGDQVGRPVLEVARHGRLQEGLLELFGIAR